MTADERQFAAKIATYLNLSAAEPKPGTLYQLQQARARALAQLAETERERNLTLAGAHGFAGGAATAGRPARRGHLPWVNWALWVGIVLIVAGGVFFQDWDAAQETREIEETDAAILASDLPIDAYLDQGFHTWLRLQDDN